MKVGDTVWVLCEVIKIQETGEFQVSGPLGGSFWITVHECKPVEPEAVEQTETVGPKSICVGDAVTFRWMKGIVTRWCETRQRFFFQSEHGSEGWVIESELSPVEPESNPPITKEDVSVVDRYCELVRSQSDFAWTIFCNLAVMAQDAGAPHKESNERAADLMRNWFGVDVRKFVQWQYANLNPQVTAEIPSNADSIQFKPGDKVWVQATVLELSQNSVLVRGYADKSWWMRDKDCKPVETEAVKQPTSDPVNPSHYKQLPAEVIDIIEAAIANAPNNKAAGLHWQVLKYALRCWFKNGIEDLKKARWYLDRLIKEEEAK